MTAPLSQTQAPLLEALQTLATEPDTPFYCPGHKRGRGAWQPLAQLIGQQALQADLPELPALDNLFAPTGAIAAAQALAAEAFGADRSWFLTNGTSCGVIAAILATCTAGDKIILPRNCHQSAISGLILAGAIPAFVNPAYDPTWGLSYSVTPKAISAALRAHPDAKAVMLVYPTYQGIGGDLAAIAKLVHARKIPLLVDEAHGGHFAFHPELPPSALSLGADLSVQSLHKTAGALTQASILHLKGDRISPENISRALQLLQSTSPNYLLHASLDAARQQLALAGESLLGQTLALADRAHQALAEIPGIGLLREPNSDTLDPAPGWHWRDRTRLTLDLYQLAIDGFAADEWLQARNIVAELQLPRHLTFVITHGNTDADMENLVAGVAAMAREHPLDSPDRASDLGNAFIKLPPPISRLSPRQAFEANTRTLPIREAIGRISAELVCPYPPGIPVLLPGEVVSAEAIAYLQTVRWRGGIITGCSDSRLATLQVVG